MFIVRWEIKRNSLSEKLPGMQDLKLSEMFEQQLKELKKFGAETIFDISVDGLLYKIDLVFENKSQWESYMTNRIQEEAFSEDWVVFAGTDYEYDENYDIIEFSRDGEKIIITRQFIEETS